MEQAKNWAENVFVEVDGSDGEQEEITYMEYVTQFLRHVLEGILHIPSRDHPDVNDLAEDIDASVDTVRNRLSYLLFPGDLRAAIDSGELTKTAARQIAKRCASNGSDRGPSSENGTENASREYGGVDGTQLDRVIAV